MKTKSFFNILLYASFVFLIVFLYKFNYLEVNVKEINTFYLIISIVFLWAGFYLSTLSWWFILRKHHYRISTKTALVSQGLSVFAKYIPGKVWVILGRAAKAADGKYPVKEFSYISLKEQILYLWAGLLIGNVPLFVYKEVDIFSVGVSILFIVISFITFSDKFRVFVIWTVKRIFKKELEIPKISFKNNLSVLAYIFLYWSVWILSFYFLSKSLYNQTTFEIGFIFPLGVSVGLLAVIVPGGIGVREGIMVTFMVLAGIPLEIASTVSVISRLWFITGELFIFLSAVLVRNFHKRKEVVPKM